MRSALGITVLCAANADDLLFVARTRCGYPRLKKQFDHTAGCAATGGVLQLAQGYSGQPVGTSVHLLMPNTHSLKSEITRV